MGATAFWTIDNNEIVNLIASYDGIRTFIDFPLSSFNVFLQVFFTFLMPYAFVSFYPSIYFLNKGNEQMLFTPLFQYSTPLVGVIVFACGVLFWYKGLKRYSGVGS
jgi:ABC-2 type transport system permease protein